MGLGTLCLLVALGLAGPALSAVPRVGPPLVVGEILIGVAFGRSGLGLVPVTDPSLNLLSETGFALLMLIVGTHLPIHEPGLRPALRKALPVVALTGVLSLAAGFALAPLTGLHAPLVIAVLLATSSGAVALPVLQALERHDDVLLVATAWIAVADVLTVLAIPLVIRQGSLLQVLAGIAAVVLLAAAVYLVARRFTTSSRIHGLRHRSKKQHWALDLRISLLVLLALATIAVRQNTSVLIAGFAAGTVLALLGEPRRLSWQLIGLGEGFLIPLFFVTLGAKLDLHALVTQRANLELAAALSVGAVAVHVLAARLLRLPLGTGLLASAQLGVPSAVATLGLSTGLLQPGQAAAVLAAALVSLAACAAGASMLGHVNGIGGYGAPAVDASPAAG
jgi:Kef-type K+ transport system membrane component KefB